MDDLLRRGAEALMDTEWVTESVEAAEMVAEMVQAPVRERLAELCAAGGFLAEDVYLYSQGEITLAQLLESQGEFLVRLREASEDGWKTNALRGAVVEEGVTEVPDLMEALQRSLEEARAAREKVSEDE